MPHEPPVRSERSEWRDLELSKRHRHWGFNCPAADLDLLMVEYHHGWPVGLVEYKHHLAKRPDFEHPTYRALTALAGGYEKGALPFFIARYWPDVWAFQIFTINDTSKKWFKDACGYSESQYVRTLYQMRQYQVSCEVLNKLAQTLPPDADVKPA